jgi:hypothetical protein
MYDRDMLIAQITDLHISTSDSVNDRHFRTAGTWRARWPT